MLGIREIGARTWAVATYPVRLIRHVLPHLASFGICVAGLLITFALAWEFSLHFNCGNGRSFIESTFRAHGMALQLLGLAGVAVGIRENLQLLNRPSFMDRIRAVYRSRPRVFYKRHTSHGALIAAAASMGASASATLGWSWEPGHSVEGRVIALERKAREVEVRLAAARAAVEHEARSRAAEIEKEKGQRVAEDARLSQLLDSAIGGGISLEARGLVYLIVGTVHSGLAPELQRWLPTVPVACPPFAS